jgi:sugar phosphate isomerase/epimerase
MFIIHIHDNHGESDEHTIPFEGYFNWENFARVLARSPYKLPILMEPSCREEGDDTAWLKRAFDAGNRFTTMMEKYRP